MRWIITKVSAIGQFLMGLSDRTHLALVLCFLLVLGGSGVYKLIKSIENLQEPQPAASPDQLIKPMEKLFMQTRNEVGHYQQAKQHDMHQLDSLAKAYSKK